MDLISASGGMEREVGKINNGKVKNIIKIDKFE